MLRAWMECSSSSKPRSSIQPMLFTTMPEAATCTLEFLEAEAGSTEGLMPEAGKQGSSRSRPSSRARPMLSITSLRPAISLYRGVDNFSAALELRQLAEEGCHKWCTHTLPAHVPADLKLAPCGLTPVPKSLILYPGAEGFSGSCASCSTECMAHT